MELKNEQRFNKAWIELQKAFPFYANILMHLTRSLINDKNEPFPAAVHGSQGTITLVINEFYFKEFNPMECMAILQHEMLHIVFHHLTVMRGCLKEDRGLANIAADCAVNQYVNGLPKGCITLDELRNNFPKVASALKPKLSGLDYYNILRSDPDVQNAMAKAKALSDAIKDFLNQEGNGSDGNESGDSKSKDNPENGQSDLTKKLAKAWKDVDGSCVTEAEVKNIERIAKHVTKQATIKSAGKLPAGMEEILKELYTTCVPWDQMLRVFVDKIIPGLNKRPVFHRQSRRYSAGSPKFPGYINEPEPKILAMVDTSGSMNSHDLGLAIGELKRIHRMGYQVDVAEVDATIHRIYPIERWDSKIQGRGGTMFDKFFELADTLPHSGLIIITDGYIYGQRIKCNKQMIWLITPRGNPHDKPGMVIQIGEEYAVNEF